MIIDRLNNGNVEISINGNPRVFTGYYIIHKLIDSCEIREGRQLLLEVSVSQIDTITNKGVDIPFTDNDDLYEALRDVIFNRALDVTVSNGVPSTFTELTGSGGSIFLQKGNLNEFKLRPQVLNEHVESTREVQATVTATNIVGQIFKASHDNINTTRLAVESAAGMSIDDFESYANDAALQAVWVESGNVVTIETTIVTGGSQSMKLDGTTLNDEWIKTISPTDYEGFTGSFDFYQDRSYSTLKFDVFIGDGTNTKSAGIVINEINTWHDIEILEASMSEDGVGTTNVNAIIEIGFRVSDRRSGNFGYVDNLVATPPPGSFGVKLYDMGTSIPVSTTTSIDDGTQYTELGDRGIGSGVVVSEVIVPLTGGKRQYQIDNFVAGVALEIPDNTTLNIGNYYLITLNYIDTEIDIYGPDTSFSTNYYNNGYAFTAPNESTAITAIGPNSDLSFSIFSTQDIYLTQYFQTILSATGAFATMGINSSVSGHIQDSNMGVTNQITTQVPASPNITIEFFVKPFFMEKGGKFEINLNDDFTDDAIVIGGAIGYIYEKLPVNG